jgi:hypothetical protein
MATTQCPHCGEELPTVVDAFCPFCRESLDESAIEPETLPEIVLEPQPGAKIIVDVSSGRVTLRQYLGMILGSAVSTVVGAFFGLVVVGTLMGGEANPVTLSFVCLTSFFGWFFWVRRNQSPKSTTLGICAVLLVLWYPFAGILREVTRSLL